MKSPTKKPTNRKRILKVKFKYRKILTAQKLLQTFYFRPTCVEKEPHELSNEQRGGQSAHVVAKVFAEQDGERKEEALFRLGRHETGNGL